MPRRKAVETTPRPTRRPEDEAFRRDCLELAVSHHGRNAHPDAILKTAKRLENYVKQGE